MLARKRRGEAKRNYKVLKDEMIHNAEYSDALERELIELSVLNTKVGKSYPNLMIMILLLS